MTSVALAEELLLLAYDDETGRCGVPVIALDLGMAAAILVDLVLHGRIEVSDRLVVPIDASPTGHDINDEVLGRIGAERPEPAAFWLQRLRHNLRHLAFVGRVSFHSLNGGTRGRRPLKARSGESAGPTTSS